MSVSAIALRAFGVTLIGALLGALVAFSVVEGRVAVFLGMSLGAAATSAVGWLILIQRHYREFANILPGSEVLQHPAKPHTH